MFRTLIVDDEELARLRMIKLLEAHADKIEVVGEAFDGCDAVEKIQKLKPDLVFLDIQMPGMTGFEVLSDLEDGEIPMVVFATAFDEYAIKAFEENAIDYLLKPIETERLQQTIDKLERVASAQGPEDNLRETVRQLIGQIQNEKEEVPKPLQRLQVKIGDRTLLVATEKAIRFEAEDKYTTVHTDESRYVIDTPLVELEKRLDPEMFMRIHRAHLVNITRITEIQRQFGGRLKVVLNDKNKSALPVSRNFVEKVRSL